MERKQDESFEAYKLRRTISNQVRKNINWQTKHQTGVQSARAKLRDSQKDRPNYHGGTYGKDLIAMFARQRPDLPERQHKHKEYLEAQASKRALRNQDHGGVRRLLMEEAS